MNSVFELRWGMRCFLLLAVLLGSVFWAPIARGAGFHTWEVSSSHHEQTFAYGSERRRSWTQRGNHLELNIHFTNDPYVDQTNPRQYDDFTFPFPNVTLGADRQTFFYHPPGHRPVPVAVIHSGLFDQIRLLPSSYLVVNSPHGRLTLTLVISEPGAGEANESGE